MSIFCKVSADILHIVGILMVCKYYIQLNERIEDKFRYVKVLLMSIIISQTLNEIESQTIALIIYLLCIVIIVHICYSENFIKLLICALWVIIVVEIIDMISISVMNTIGTVINYHNESLENLMAMVLSVVIIYIISVLLRRTSNDGIKRVSLQYWGVFTVILFADLVILMLM